MKAQPPIRKDLKKKPKTRGRSRAMLHAGRQVEFHYFLKQLVQGYGISDADGEPFMGTLSARAMREGRYAALEFVDQKIEEQFLPPEAKEELGKLLYRFSRMR